MEQPEKPGGRLSNGQFASKDTSKVEADRGPGGRYVKGRKRTGGRAPGTPNKTTRAVKEFLRMLADDGDVQEAVRERILAGDAVAFFRAVDHVLGKPKESVELDVTLNVLDARIEAGRKRLGLARASK